MSKTNKKVLTAEQSFATLAKLFFTSSPGLQFLPAAKTF